MEIFLAAGRGLQNKKEKNLPVGGFSKWQSRFFMGHLQYHLADTPGEHFINSWFFP